MASGEEESLSVSWLNSGNVLTPPSGISLSLRARETLFPPLSILFLALQSSLVIPMSSTVLSLFENFFYNTQCNLYLTLVAQANSFHHPPSSYPPLCSAWAVPGSLHQSHVPYINPLVLFLDSTHFNAGVLCPHPTTSVVSVSFVNHHQQRHAPAHGNICNCVYKTVVSLQVLKNKLAPTQA